jgi:hypothetical protein
MLRNNEVNFPKPSERKMSENFLHFNNLVNGMNAVTILKLVQKFLGIQRKSVETNPS